MNKNEFIITLLKLPKIGKVTAKKIADEIYNCNISLIDLLQYFNTASKWSFTLNDLHKANESSKEIIKLCAEKNIKIVNYSDQIYPKKLMSLKNPPVLLYYKGEIIRLNEKPSIAIIGTREPSDYGVKIAKLYSSYFSKKSFNIVSGLAKGIDSIGHESTMVSNGYAYAFIAQGLNTPLYPKESRVLADNILNNGGAIISEYEPNAKPSPSYFIERDRLQCGASDSVLVIETDINGGTMHAANGCLSLNRVCAVLDHPEKFKLNNSKARGNQKLIGSDGALPVFTEKSLDVLTGLILAHHKDFFSLNQVCSQKENSVSKVEEEVAIEQIKFDI